MKEQIGFSSKTLFALVTCVWSDFFMHNSNMFNQSVFLMKTLVTLFTCVWSDFFMHSRDMSLESEFVIEPLMTNFTFGFHVRHLELAFINVVFFMHLLNVTFQVVSVSKSTGTKVTNKWSMKNRTFMRVVDMPVEDAFSWKRLVADFTLVGFYRVFFMHRSNMLLHRGFLRKALFTLVTCMWPDFFMHFQDMALEIDFARKLLRATVTFEYSTFGHLSLNKVMIVTQSLRPAALFVVELDATQLAKAVRAMLARVRADHQIS